MCRGGPDVTSLGDALKWDHRLQTHLDTHAKQDPTRILGPGGFSGRAFTFTVDCFIKQTKPTVGGTP